MLTDPQTGREDFTINREVISDWKTQATLGIRNFEYAEAVK